MVAFGDCLVAGLIAPCVAVWLGGTGGLLLDFRFGLVVASVH